MPWDTIDPEYRDPAVQRGMELIGAAVRRRRERLGLSQRDLERRARVDQTTISRLENGRRVGLRLARLARLVAALDGLDFEEIRVDRADGERQKPRSIRSMYAQIQTLQEAIYQARIVARVRQVEDAELGEDLSHDVERSNGPPR
jgi:transcriptional regulator with XRE-family HTH domain